MSRAVKTVARDAKIKKIKNFHYSTLEFFFKSSYFCNKWKAVKMVTIKKKYKKTLFDLVKKVARNRSKILKNLPLFNFEVLCFKKSLYSTSISKATKKKVEKVKKGTLFDLRIFFKSLFFLRTQERVEKTTRKIRWNTDCLPFAKKFPTILEWPTRKFSK